MTLMGRKGSNLRSQIQNLLPYHLATPQSHALRVIPVSLESFQHCDSDSLAILENPEKVSSGLLQSQDENSVSRGTDKSQQSDTNSTSDSGTSGQAPHPCCASCTEILAAFGFKA